LLVKITPPSRPPESGTQGKRWGSRTLRKSVAGFDPDRITIRPARIGDMRVVEPLIRDFASANLMLSKSLDQLTRSFREFVVAEYEDGDILGCGALRMYSEDLAEVCSLAVDRRCQGHGIGRRIVERLLDDARELGIRSAFALTLEPEFFARLGFHVVRKEQFPLKVWADCRSCPKLHACDEVAVAVDLAVRDDQVRPVSTALGDHLVKPRSGVDSSRRSEKS
jgi:amino-acid N-acetyltransferase